MQQGDPALISLISQRIRDEGPLTFRAFMETALYHPEHGYYGAGKASIGRKGDFFTSVSTGPLFGKLLGLQFREMWERMGKPTPFTIVEQGAHHGDFAGDVLKSLDPEFLQAVDYVIIEPNQKLRDAQQQALARFPQLRWRPSLDELEPFRGVHFSNELIDAMPVHIVKHADGAWKELYVTSQNEAFIFEEGPLSTEALASHLKKLPSIATENYTTEINLYALDWIAALSRRLESGFVLVADYGYPRRIYYSPERTAGTLSCYAQHQRSHDPLQNIGNADITAHVDFTSLAERAIEHGLRVSGFADQHHFMVGLGKRVFPDSDEPPNEQRQKELRAFQMLMHPSLMGMNFKFLGLEKSIPAGALAGFEFSPTGASLLS